jgi:hypothetical protein
MIPDRLVVVVAANKLTPTESVPAAVPEKRKLLPTELRQDVQKEPNNFRRQIPCLF